MRVYFWGLFRPHVISLCTLCAHLFLALVSVHPISWEPASFLPPFPSASPQDDLTSSPHLLKSCSSFMPYFQTHLFHRTFWTCAAQPHFLKTPLPSPSQVSSCFLPLLRVLFPWSRQRYPALSCFFALLVSGVTATTTPGLGSRRLLIVSCVAWGKLLGNSEPFSSSVEWKLKFKIKFKN